MKRRQVLRGLGGVAVALPFLETFNKKEASAQSGVYDSFVVFVREANGFAQATNDGEPERFYPSQTGTLTQASLEAEPDRCCSIFAPYADKTIITRGFRFAYPGNGCGHSGGGNQVLTAAKVSPDFFDNESLAMGESIDNRIARELHADTPPLTLLSGKTSGYLNEVLSFTNNKVQGSQAHQLRPAQNSAYGAYQDLFGLSTLEPEAFERLKQQRKSVNDLVREEMQVLLSRQDLSSDDRQRLEVHFDSIRDLENTINCSLDDGTLSQMEMMDSELGNQDGDIVLAATRMHMDVMALALACGVVRTGTLQIGHGNDHTEYWIGGQKQPPFHWISHRIQGDGGAGSAPPIANADQLHAEIDRFHAEAVKYLCDKLASYSVGNGTLLDAGAVVFTNDLANKYHSYNNVPFVIIGGANGFLRTGQYIDVGDQTHNKLLSTLGSAAGVRKPDGGLLDDFGDPELETGVVSEIIA